MKNPLTLLFMTIRKLDSTEDNETIETFLEEFKKAFPTAYRHYELLEDGCMSEKTKELVCAWLEKHLRPLLWVR